MSDHSRRRTASARLRRLSRVLGAATTAGLLVGALIVLTEPPGASAAPATPVPVSPRTIPLAPAAARALASDTTSPPRIVVDPGHGVATSVSARRGHPFRRPPTVPAGAGAATVAKAFVARHKQAFGVADPAGVRVVDAVRAPAGLDTVVRLQQTISGLPVIGGQLTVTVTNQGEVLSAAGTPHTAALAPAATVTAAAAVTVAVAAAVGRNRAGIRAAKPGVPQLWLYDKASVGQPGAAGLHPVWRIEVAHGAHRYEILINARSGTVDLLLLADQRARSRSVCDAANAALDNSDPAAVRCGTASLPVRRTEGGAPYSVAAVNEVYDYLGDTYDFFQSHFGRDSVDDAGLPLKATVRVCDVAACPYENAYWNGEQMVLGTNLSGADDVIAHELTHGITQDTSNLFYAYQSGAINEAMSDIFGEFVDLTNGRDGSGTQTRWQMGEDIMAGPLAGGLRNMANPPAYDQPDKMTSSLYEPDNGWYSGTWDNGGVHTNSGVANKAAFLMVDGGTFNGRTVTGIGVDKTAQVFYRTLLALPSGADYAVLGPTLSSSCQQLIGTGGLGITGGDCGQVDTAVAATEMTSDPVVANAAAPEAEVCPTGRVQSVLAAESLDSGTPAITWDTFDSLRQIGWKYDSMITASGRTSLLGLTGFNPSNHQRAMYWNTPITVAADTTTYFRFAHAYQFDYEPGPVNYDGGTLQIAVNGGAYQTVSAALLVNGFNGTLTENRGSAWTGDSRGYISTRLNLTSYAGSTVRLRFLISGDTSFASFWAIDDLAFYTCVGATATATTITGISRPARPSLPLQLSGTVLAGAAPVTAGPVILERRTGSAPSWAEVLRTTPDGDGRWAVRTLVPSTADYRIRYAGSGVWTGSVSTTVTVTVLSTSPRPRG